MIKEIRLKKLKNKIRINEDGTKIYFGNKVIYPYKEKGNRSKKGFYRCCIGGEKILVHRLVAMAFVPNEHPKKYTFVLHKDGNTLNNYFKNLQWGDPLLLAQNMKVIGKFNYHKIKHKD